MGLEEGAVGPAEANSLAHHTSYPNEVTPGLGQTSKGVGQCHAVGMQHAALFFLFSALRRVYCTRE